MLVLKRRFHENIEILTSDGKLVISVEEITSGAVKLGFNGPREIQVVRGEISKEAHPHAEGHGIARTAGRTQV